MKILVSDYDGTYMQDYKSPRGVYKNNNAIKQFIENGNIFVFATARSYMSIKSEIEKYNIPYNYLICNDGLFIVDSNDNIIYENIMDNNKKDEIVDIINPISHKISLRDKFGIEQVKEILEVVAFIKLGIKTKDIMEIISKKGLYVAKYLTNIYIKNKTDKSIGIRLLMEHINIDAEVHTIGDNINDLGMLKEFNGHKVITCYPVLYGKGIDTSLSVRSLVKKL